MTSLVGFTGFVGSNIYEKGSFDGIYNSKNIEEAYGTNPDLLIYAGLRAEKYLANNAPEKDMNIILQAEENINRINPKKLVLISTIDVFKKPYDVDENSSIEIDGLHAYGYNRYMLELWVREHYPDALIIRLPGLIGHNIKKNFIYDIINYIPFMIKKEKFKVLQQCDDKLDHFYELQNNGFYKLKSCNSSEKTLLKAKFKKIGFSALNFTDSRSSYQFYDLSRLWSDIGIALDNNIKLWHPATEPVTASEVYGYLTGEVFENELDVLPAKYDYKTIYSDIFGGQDGYISDKQEVLHTIKEFVEKEQQV